MNFIAYESYTMHRSSNSASTPVCLDAMLTPSHAKLIQSRPSFIHYISQLVANKREVATVPEMSGESSDASTSLSL